VNGLKERAISALNSYKKLRLRKSTLNFITVVATVFILGFSFLSYFQVRKLIHAHDLVSHTYRVIQTVDAALYDIVLIESNQRAYLISGNNEYIADIDKDKTDLAENLTSLKNLTANNKAQQARIDEFINLVKLRLNRLHQMIELKKRNEISSVETVSLFEKNRAISAQVKFIAREIKEIEFVLLNERIQKAIHNSSVASFIIIIGSILSISAFMFACLLANNAYVIRTKSEKKRINIETRMRNILESTSDMIAAVDMNYQYVLLNQAYQNEFKKLFGVSIEVGDSVIAALENVTDVKEEVIKAWQASLQVGEYTKNIALNLNNERNLYEITSSSSKDANGKINGAVHIIRNITARMKEQMELEASYQKLDSSMQKLQEKNEQITALVEMSDILLACNSLDELIKIISKYCRRILSFSNGYLYLMNASKNYLEIANTWGVLVSIGDKIFQPEQCWGIRLGRKHFTANAKNALTCDHTQIVKYDNDHHLVCIPLMAQNDIYGLLYVEVPHDVENKIPDDQLLLINAFSELVALALANVRLRENLRYQSIRDPLTGLYNRRYLEDFFVKQIYQAERARVSIAVLMLDMDHFKKINDTYGHDAGDLVLKEMSKILQSDIRISDISARYGGEEFIVLLYDVDKDEALARAEHVRKAVSYVHIKYGAQHVASISVSIGIAIYPSDGQTAQELIEAADKALYHAKNTGRDKVAAYSDISSAIEEKTPA
jgi:diguanylate cyclase (GGDEF)-like protein